MDAVQCNAEPCIPIIGATVAAVGQTDVAKAIKERIDKFSEGMPVLLNALDELKNLHPFIGGELILWCTFIRGNRESSRCPGVQNSLHSGAKASRQ